MGDQGESFADLAYSLVQALDAWATCVGEPTAIGKPTRKALVSALEREREQLADAGQSRKKIDEALLSYWLKGRGQLLPGSKRNRLPSEEDCAAIARALKEKAPKNAQRLPGIGREIADLARRLDVTAGQGWRDQVLASVTAQPTQHAGPAEGAMSVKPTTGRRRWKDWRIWAAAAVAAGAITLLVWPDDGKSTTSGKKPDGLATPSAQGVDVGEPGASASATSGSVEGNHRCGRARSAGAVSWMPCALITKDGTVSFLVQLTNTSSKPVTVKTKLAYVQAQVVQACPEPWGTSAKVTVPAGATQTSPSGTCTTSLTPAQAFQTRAWVVAKGATQWGYREHSPTLHVQADGAPVWADEAR
ncbi:hypothetical protein PV416_46560 [Streptomyces ipomoeae]|uniref:hypothetical protein n=1 Tax=Streptomyces ipomoeae TaxID=103232 RepID=UPI00114620F6|nr:hypothetical protein [Streptomyces ipomoeae]MDX2828317.1 hypothetical protein [Streptomyces ipomoeae]MDX2880809.1 hypothetical protein [Streptomyces ipomoeae]MDX2939536.1 hypothetical protein [Streptomyces ipomoeae]TQE27966.1 hypothetical protein SipoB123_10850 [Streptomyces ipomoeae]